MYLQLLFVFIMSGLDILYKIISKFLGEHYDLYEKWVNGKNINTHNLC